MNRNVAVHNPSPIASEADAVAKNTGERRSARNVRPSVVSIPSSVGSTNGI
jgi:hypothetical protein